MNNTTIISYAITARGVDTRGAINILAYSILAVLCIFANSLVCYVIVTRKTTDGSLKYFVFLLAIADILVGAVCIPLFLAKEYILFSNWNLLESFSTGFDLFCGTCSILHLCLMAFDRAMSVTKPILYHTVMRHRKATLRLLLIPWFISLTLANIPFIGRSKKFEYRAALGIIILIPIPCVFMVVCYAKLYFTIKKRNAKLKQSSETVVRVDQTHMMKMILCMMLAFVTCWIPFMAYHSIKQFNPSLLDKQTDHPFYYSAKFLSYFNSVCNPIIYALLNPIFRNGFKDVLKSFFHLNKRR